MIYQLDNQQEFASVIQEIQKDATSGQFKVSDFQWFITTIQEAISKKLKVDFRYDCSEGLVVFRGTIKSSKLTYNSGNPNSCMLTMVFDNETKNQTETLTYTFNAELVEENTHSMPGNFMKYYIKNDDCSVIVGIIVYYK